ncbi:MAG: endolytic transglycosylase MltG, partial [Clostridia bacterium]|nr:endolytic transglycosylase MltG [Clostridia bacterium]
VSAIFHNRLKQGMKLQSDPTAKYTDGSTNMVLTSAQVNLETPYNTYVISGLPAGPICNPSPAALKAALHPNQSFIDEGYLYFCSKDPNSGELHFSQTLEEHERAVAEYRPLWEAFDEAQRKAAEEAARAAMLEAAASPDPSATVDPAATADPSATAVPAP